MNNEEVQEIFESKDEDFNETNSKLNLSVLLFWSKERNYHFFKGYQGNSSYWKT